VREEGKKKKGGRRGDEDSAKDCLRLALGAEVAGEAATRTSESRACEGEERKAATHHLQRPVS